MQRRSQEKIEERREAILVAAKDLFQTKEYDQISFNSRWSKALLKYYGKLDEGTEEGILSHD